MDLLSLLFPSRCLGCREIGIYLCPDCVNYFVPLKDLYCPICRRASVLGQTHVRCRLKYSIDGVISGYPYAGLMTRAISKFKYSFVSDLTHTLVELMASGINHPALFKHAWVLIPVPLHPSRLKWRGFNQAELLSKGLSESWHNACNNQILVRLRATPPQMKLTGSMRKTNLSRAFAVITGVKVPEYVLLVDDVATTCSTLNECARTLKQAGAKEVWGLTLAQKIPS